MRHIGIQTVYRERQERVHGLCHKLSVGGFIPQVIMAKPEETARQTFARAIKSMAGAEYAVLLQDDVILAPDFDERLPLLLNTGAPVITGYSNSKYDLTNDGASRRITGSQFCNLQCVAVASGLVPDLLAFAPGWYKSHPEHENTFDLMFGAFCSRQRIAIQVATPSLVQHDSTPSLMGHDYGRRRSRSFTAAYPETCPYARN